MFTYLVRAKNKRGFTLVELMVIIGIITIMSAIGVPSLINSNRRADAIRHNDHARSFYLAVQQTHLSTMQNDNTNQEFRIDGRNRVTCKPTPSSTSCATAPCIHTIVESNNDFFLYVVMDSIGNITSADLAFTDAATYVGGGGEIAEYPGTADNDIAFGFLVREIEGNITGSGEPGHYYAMFDSEFRMVMTYYSKFADKAEVGDYSFSSDNNRNGRQSINGRTFGAFPIQYAFTGRFAVDGTEHVGLDTRIWFGADTMGIIPGV